MTVEKVIDFDPGDPDFYQNPYPAYEVMREAGRIVYWPHYDLWCFPHYEEVSAIFRDRRFGRQDPCPEPVPDRLASFYRFEAASMLELEPPDHTRLRRLVNRAFTSRAVASVRPGIAYLADRLIDGFGDDVDLIADYATPIPLLTIAALLGTPLDKADQMLEWSHHMVAMYQHNRDEGVEAAAVRATEEFSRFIRDLIARKRRHPSDDLMSELIAVEEEGDRLSSDELVTTCILLMNAGHEATVHAIGNSIANLLELGIDPRQALSEPRTANRAVDEMLRFDPPLHMFTRYVLEDVEICDMHFQRGQSVGLILGSANRDPATFANPDALDLLGRNTVHTSFGAGIHFCVGAALARAEVEIALRRLFERLPYMTLKEKPQFADRYHFHGLKELRITKN